MKSKYFYISYLSTMENSLGFGSCAIEVKNGYFNIKKVQQKLSDINKLNCTIINFTEIVKKQYNDFKEN